MRIRLQQQLEGRRKIHPDDQTKTPSHSDLVKASQGLYLVFPQFYSLSWLLNEFHHYIKFFIKSFSPFLFMFI